MIMTGCNSTHSSSSAQGFLKNALMIEKRTMEHHDHIRLLETAASLAILNLYKNSQQAHIATSEGNPN